MYLYLWPFEHSCSNEVPIIHCNNTLYTLAYCWYKVPALYRTWLHCFRWVCSFCRFLGHNRLCSQVEGAAGSLRQRVAMATTPRCTLFPPRLHQRRRTFPLCGGFFRFWFLWPMRWENQNLKKIPRSCTFLPSDLDSCWTGLYWDMLSLLFKILSKI